MLNRSNKIEFVQKRMLFFLVCHRYKQSKLNVWPKIRVDLYLKMIIYHIHILRLLQGNGERVCCNIKHAIFNTNLTVLWEQWYYQLLYKINSKPFHWKFNPFILFVNPLWVYHFTSFQRYVTQMWKWNKVEISILNFHFNEISAFRLGWIVLYKIKIILLGFKHPRLSSEVMSSKARTFKLIVTRKSDSEDFLYFNCFSNLQFPM